MKASKAKELADNSKSSIVKEQLIKILSEIQSNAKIGLYSLYCNEKLFPEVVAHLKELGYDVQRRYVMFSETDVIRWD